MARTFTELSNSLRTFANDLPLKVSNTAKTCADRIAQDLVQSTPVDTGDAMSNWRVSLNAPIGETALAYNRSPRGRMIAGNWTHTVEPIITFFGNVGPATEQIQSAIASKQPEEPIFIANNLPYIQRLDTGASDQEPAEFVSRAMILGEATISVTKIL
jgi:hypothetical protein